MSVIFDPILNKLRNEDAGGGGNGVPAIAVSDANAAEGTIQVRPVTIAEDGAVSWAGAPVTARYTWPEPEGE